jgi:hypothetical protein
MSQMSSGLVWELTEFLHKKVSTYHKDITKQSKTVPTLKSTGIIITLLSSLSPISKYGKDEKHFFVSLSVYLNDK